MNLFDEFIQLYAGQAEKNSIIFKLKLQNKLFTKQKKKYLGADNIRKNTKSSVDQNT